MRSSAYGSVFDPDQTVVFGSDAAGLYSRGYYSYGKEHLEMTVEATRHQAEMSDNVTSFLIQRSLGGGTGAGFGSLLMERLTGDFPKAPLLEVAAYPSPGVRGLFICNLMRIVFDVCNWTGDNMYICVQISNTGILSRDPPPPPPPHQNPFPLLLNTLFF